MLIITFRFWGCRNRGSSKGISLVRRMSSLSNSVEDLFRTTLVDQLRTTMLVVVVVVVMDWGRSKGWDMDMIGIAVMIMVSPSTTAPVLQSTMTTSTTVTLQRPSRSRSVSTLLLFIRNLPDLSRCSIPPRPVTRARSRC